MKNKYLLIIPFLTLLVGFIPFLFLSIYYSIFFSKAIVTIPLIYNSSVMIGDAVLLPIINYTLFSIIFKIDDIIKYNKRTIYIYIAISILISIALNLSIHLAWSNDAITDFIAFTQSNFSIIGIWHLVFSILQTIILFIFILVWYLCIKAQKRNLFSKLNKLWVLVFLFTSLSIVDMVIKYIFIFQGKTFYEVLLIDRFAFVTPALTIGVFIFFKFYERRMTLSTNKV